MINRKNAFIFIAGLLMFASESCGTNIGDKSSPSIEYAKEVGTYICEYTPMSVFINDSIKFEITSVFAEYRYRQLDEDLFFVDYSIDTSKSQLVLYIKPSWGELYDSSGYSETWKFSNMYSVRKNTWVIDIDKPIPPDTVKVEVINDEADSTGGPGIHYGEKIGEFIVIKKSNN